MLVNWWQARRIDGSRERFVKMHPTLEFGGFAPLRSWMLEAGGSQDDAGLELLPPHWQSPQRLTGRDAEDARDCLLCTFKKDRRS